MRVGTKSLLFGVHAFWWHPLVVLVAWCKLYRRWPCFWELLGIILHDIGYWGCSDMDGEGGRDHPKRGALLVFNIVKRLYDLNTAVAACYFTAFHSSSFAERCQLRPSSLCAPDKLSTLWDPWWFYLFRAWMSGELAEYRRNGPAGLTAKEWLFWLRDRFRVRFMYPKRGPYFMEVLVLSPTPVHKRAQMMPIIYKREKSNEQENQVAKKD